MFPRMPINVFCRHLHKIGVVGVPFSKGQRKSGPERAPKIVRDSGLLKKLAGMGIDVKDYGDVSYTPKNVQLRKTNNWGDVSECNRMLSSSVFQIIKDNRMGLIIGGDHSIAIGSLDGHVKGVDPMKVAVVWVDAHADINTHQSTPSGSIHGMPLALSLKELRSEWPNNIPNLEWQNLSISVKNLGYIALRDVNPYEKELIERHNIVAYYASDVKEIGINKIITEVLKTIDPDETCSLHVSFDIDSLDILFAPSTGTRVPGGITVEDAITVLQTVFKTGRLQVIDLVEINPALGSKEDIIRTVKSGNEVVLGAFKK